MTQKQIYVGIVGANPQRSWANVSHVPTINAKAMFFPQISLLGSGGAAFGHSQFGADTIPTPLGIGTYTAGLSQPIFDAGALRNNLRYAKSQERQALNRLPADDSASLRRCLRRTDWL
jgi:hypothetical protein